LYIHREMFNLKEFLGFLHEGKCRLALADKKEDEAVLMDLLNTLSTNSGFLNISAIEKIGLNRPLHFVEII
jgi:hypothetical protein